MELFQKDLNRLKGIQCPKQDNDNFQILLSGPNIKGTGDGPNSCSQETDAQVPS